MKQVWHVAKKKHKIKKGNWEEEKSAACDAATLADWTKTLGPRSVRVCVAFGQVIAL